MNDYVVTVDETEIILQKDAVDTLDSISLGDDSYHILENTKAYRAQLIISDFGNKTATISINGNPYSITIADGYDQQVKKMGLLAVSAQKMNSIVAPMPGLIVDVMVREGEEISEGTPLLVLSAMKMENVILSQGEGIVKSIAVKKDDAVEKGQLVIEME